MENHEVTEIENKKSSFRRYRKNLACIERLEEKLILLTERINSVRSPNLSGMPRGSTPITVEDLIGDKEELEQRLNRLRTKTRQLKQEILSEIDTLEDERYCEILEAHFIEGLTLERIADRMGYTERYIYQLYKKALVILTKNNKTISVKYHKVDS